MSTLKCAIPLVLLLLLAPSTASQEYDNIITLYDGILYTGNSMNVTTTTCTNLLPSFNQKVQSADSHGNCANLYDEEFCRGDYFITGHKITKSHETTFRGFEDIKSVGPCDDVCSPQNLHELETKQEVTLYKTIGDETTPYTFRMTGCEHLPREFKNDISAFKIGTCIQVYSDYNCSHMAIRGRQTKGLGTHWEDGGRYELSFSYCAFNCNRQPKIQADVDQYADIGANFVVIYDGPDFQGDESILNLNNGCVDITGDWDQAVKSLRTFNICVVIYISYGCPAKIPKQYRILNESNLAVQMRLEPFRFGRRVRSIETCESVKPPISSIARESSTESLTTLTSSIETSVPASIPPKSDSLDIGMIVLYVLVGITLLISATVAAFLLFRRYQGAGSRRWEILTEKEILNFLHGEDGAIIPRHPNQVIDTAYSLPLETGYDIAREAFHFNKNNVLGSGQYAIVYKGKTLSPFSVERDVAVKTVKPHADIEYVRALLKEIKVMVYIGKSPYIIDFVGCCTQNIRNSELYVMTDICENGNMLDFLKTHTASFVNLVKKGQICKTIMRKTFALPYANTGKPSTTNFNTIHLMHWAMQIADGMAYLSSKNVIHGDLSARNILLDTDFNIKIADFGLSRALYENTQYTKKKGAPLPWRWMAIESLRNMQFSTKSDVWAFGITLWEIFTLGDLPYPGMTWTETFLTNLTDGLRPSMPSNGTSDCYNFMMACWNENPVDRISFTDLRNGFQEVINVSLSNSAYTDLTDMEETVA